MWGLCEGVIYLEDFMFKIRDGCGFLVRIFHVLFSRLFLLAIPVLALAIWWFPYSFLFDLAEYKGFDLFPNSRRVLEVPFSDPLRVSIALKVANVFSLVWLILSISCGGTYLRNIEGLAGRLPLLGKFETLKLMLYSLIALTVCLLAGFWYNGKHSWMFGSLLYDNEVLFIVVVMFGVWFATVCYSIFLSLLFRLQGKL